MQRLLVIIDPQNDFMRSPEHEGSLAIDEAYADMERLVRYLERETPEQILVTLDSHTVDHIAHARWWTDADGNHPDPFTVISVEDVVTERWRGRDPEHSLWYVKQLAKQGNYELIIWPDHCVMGTKGHQVVNILAQALHDWEQRTGRQVRYLKKGMNDYTEHYSALKAEVVIDAETDMNQDLIRYMNEFDRIEFAGEASSHCVGNTLVHFIDTIAPDDAAKVVVLENATSPVPGCAHMAEAFFAHGRKKGVQFERI